MKINLHRLLTVVNGEHDQYLHFLEGWRAVGVWDGVWARKYFECFDYCSHVYFISIQQS